MPCPDVLEIRALDGERKALVYDNYSKLIAATETIRKVRPPDRVSAPFPPQPNITLAA